MFPSAKTVKLTADTAIRGCRLQLSAVCLIFIFVCFINSLLSALISTVLGTFAAAFFLTAFFVFLICPLFLGLLHCFRQVIWGEKADIISAFRYFSSLRLYERALRFSLSLFMRAFAVSLILFLPSTMATLLSSNAFYAMFGSTMPVWALGLPIVATFLRVAGIIALTIIMLKFYPAAFLFVANENLTVSEIIGLSRAVSKNTSAEFFLLIVRLLPWMALSLLFIPLIYTFPMFISCYIVHCRFCMAKYNKIAAAFAAGTPSYEAHF